MHLRHRHLTGALCAISISGDLPGERVLRSPADDGGGGGEIPTVTGEPRRPVELTEEARLERALQRLTSPSATEEPATGAEPPAAPPAAPPETPPEEPPADGGGEQVSSLDTSATPAPPADPPERQSSSEFAAALERVTAREREIDERMRALAEREAGLKRYADFEETLQSKDVLVALEMLGYSFDDLARAAVEKRGVKGQTSELERQLRAMQEELQAIRAEREAARKAELTAQAHREIEEAIGKHSPMLAQLGERGRDAVFEHISRTYEESGGRVILPLDQAISDVERDYSAIVRQALAVESVRSQFFPSQTTPPKSGASEGRDSPGSVNPPGRPQTITNADVSAVARRADQDVVASENERLARALRHLE